ncbi:DUF3793 family protein [Mycoplasma sp. P36-A1]|uniref:DUF3793 family protein n=1 Tax=Mycoplasma sp. P36-A1 TaxID=3252900 RepID=UPI003C2B1AEA
MDPKFEEAIFWFAACTLKKIKPASMFSCKRKDYNNLDDSIKYYQELLLQYDLKLEIIQDRGPFVLLYLYRPIHLETVWKRNEVAEFLTTRGYSNNIESNLVILKEKLQKNSFPHDIGIFLGYDVDDVKSFIEHEGKNYKLIGPWKVYHKEENKQKLFSMFSRCTDNCLELFYSGHDLCSVMQN